MRWSILRPRGYPGETFAATRDGQLGTRCHPGSIGHRVRAYARLPVRGQPPVIDQCHASDGRFTKP